MSQKNNDNSIEYMGPFSIASKVNEKDSVKKVSYTILATVSPRLVGLFPKS